MIGDKSVTDRLYGYLQFRLVGYTMDFQGMACQDTRLDGLSNILWIDYPDSLWMDCLNIQWMDCLNTKWMERLKYSLHRFASADMG